MNDPDPAFDADLPPSPPDDGGALRPLFGLNPVLEALRRKLAFRRVLIAKSAGERNPRHEELIALCKEQKVQFRFEEAAWFDEKLPGKNHQGVVAELKGGARLIAELAPFLETVCRERPRPLVLVLDRVTDQQNLGAIARSAYFFGVDLIIQESSYSAPVDETVHRVSSGASLVIPFHRCEKLSSALLTLAEAGFRVLAADQESGAIPIHEADLSGRVAFILGAEGSGVRPHLLRSATAVVSIPGNGDFDSLNVGSAAAVLCQEFRRPRG
ncbi:MAG: 23S rRNA (guanosine(2251)-2'-O)-methyltransferase RlmB [Spirochaetes bacterium]|nr:23S rRNA (guanosine(2251)-2'-O)-methyltransferase RlmB [Spirochaetota bacterium]